MNTNTNTNTNVNSNTDLDNIYNSISNDQCIMLSIVIISKGIINTSSHSNNINLDSINLFEQIKYSESNENLAILNITHTDSYNQKISDRINSIYNYMGAKLIFPLIIWKNNIADTLLSTGNINRFINQPIFNPMNNYKLNILIDCIKQNIPKQNYIMAQEPIKIFNKICHDINLKCIYRNNLIDNFNSSQIIEYIESTYQIKLINITHKKYSLSQGQIQYYRQYGINNYEKSNLKSNKRKPYFDESTNILEPEQLEPEQLEPEQLEPEQLEPEQLEPEQLEPEQLEPEQLEPEQLEVREPIQEIISISNNNLNSYLNDKDYSTIFDN